MSDKQKRAINAGRKRAGLKPIKFGKKKLKTGKGVTYDKRVSVFQMSMKNKKNVKKGSAGNW